MCMQGYLFWGKNPPYMTLLDPTWLLILDWTSSKSWKLEILSEEKHQMLPYMFLFDPTRLFFLKIGEPTRLFTPTHLFDTTESE